VGVFDLKIFNRLHESRW